jgi:hypothetical protein
LETARKTARWLLTVQKPDGSFKAFVDLENNNLLSYPRVENWFGDSASLCAKNAIGLLKIYRVTGDQFFMHSAQRLILWVLRTRNEDGSFKAHAKHNFIFTHSLCYVLEALLYCALFLQREDLLNYATQGAEWLQKVQNTDGSLYKYYGSDIQIYLSQIPKRERLISFISVPREIGPTAQAARIWLILFQLKREQRFYQAALKAVAFLIDRQTLNDNSTKLNGGFPAATRKILHRYWDSSIFSSWEVMFACQAFSMVLKILQNEDYRVAQIF